MTNQSQQVANAAASVHEDGLVERGLAAFHNAVAQRDQAEHRASSFERANAILQAENESLRQKLAKTEAQLGFYMRHSVELQTHLVDAIEIIDKALKKAQQGAFRPNGAGRVEAAQIGDDGQPLPKFLTTGPAQEGPVDASS